MSKIESVKNHPPQNIVLMAGIIDILNGCSPSKVVGKIRNLAEEASMVFPNSQIYVVALASQRRGNIQNVINRVNANLKNAAKLSNFIFIGNVDVSLRQDGIHPNSDGVKALYIFSFCGLFSKRSRRKKQSSARGRQQYNCPGNHSINMIKNCISTEDHKNVSIGDVYKTNSTLNISLLNVCGLLSKQDVQDFIYFIQSNSIKGMCPKIPLCVICVHSYPNIL